MILWRLFIFCFIELALIVSRVSAQFTNITCPTSYQWSFNSKNQSPCLIAAYLGAQCDIYGWSVDPLPAGYEYYGPPAPGDPCQCSSVVYSLISVCGACQNLTWERWSTWDTNCTIGTTNGFAKTIPYATSVPHWAYQDVSLSDLFNITAAQVDAASNPPESTGILPSSTSGSSASTSASSSTSGTGSVAFGSSTILGPSSTAASNASGSKSSNVGAIAGGVVGGLAALGLIACLITYLVIRARRNERSHAPASAGFGSMHTSTNNPSPGFPPSSPMIQHRFYDPSDPSTYPGPVNSTSGSTFQTSPSTNAYYHGVPEV